MANKIDEIRIKLARSFNDFENIFIIDSMPVEVCKLSRSHTSKICKDAEYCYPNRGFCAFQKMHFYGYKLHAVCSVNGVFQSVDLSPASVHDIHYLKDIREQLSDCTLLGDKGYLSSEMQIDYAKSFEGFKTRLLAKITALTVVQFINKLNNRNINNLKISII